MKSPTEAMLYLTGIDYLVERHGKELDILSAVTGREDSLPFDAGLSTGAKIFKDRAVTVFTYPGVVTARVTGIALAYQKVKEIKGRRSEKRS